MAEQGQRGFEDLECYQLALRVLQEVYRVVKRLPPEERYNLADQMRRAAVSVVLTSLKATDVITTWTAYASTTLPVAPSTKS